LDKPCAIHSDCAGHTGYLLAAILLVEFFKVTASVDLTVVLQGFQMGDHFGSHRRSLLDPLFNFGGQRMRGY
jgi:hypothetical protein